MAQVLEGFPFCCLDFNQCKMDLMKFQDKREKVWSIFPVSGLYSCLLLIYWSNNKMTCSVRTAYFSSTSSSHSPFVKLFQWKLISWKKNTTSTLTHFIVHLAVLWLCNLPSPPTTVYPITHSPGHSRSQAGLRRWCLEGQESLLGTLSCRRPRAGRPCNPRWVHRPCKPATCTCHSDPTWWGSVAWPVRKNTARLPGGSSSTTHAWLPECGWTDRANMDTERVCVDGFFKEFTK